MDGNGRVCLGIDVEKASHRACAVGASGSVLFSVAVDNRAGDIDRALAHVGAGALVVVDQKRNIGAIAVARARAAGMEVAYLPGLTMRRARDLFPGAAKTDGIDAEVIARTAAGLPQALRRIAEEGTAEASLGMLASQRGFAVRRRVQAGTGSGPSCSGSIPPLGRCSTPRSPPALADYEAYLCLPTAPGVGPKTAAALVSLGSTSRCSAATTSSRATRSDEPG